MAKTTFCHKCWQSYEIGARHDCNPVAKAPKELAQKANTLAGANGQPCPECVALRERIVALEAEIARLKAPKEKKSRNEYMRDLMRSRRAKEKEQRT